MRGKESPRELNTQVYGIPSEKYKPLLDKHLQYLYCFITTIYPLKTNKRLPINAEVMAGSKIGAITERVLLWSTPYSATGDSKRCLTQ